MVSPSDPDMKRKSEGKAAERDAGTVPDEPMTVSEITLNDGRYLVYYSFGENSGV